jgi:transcriptional regulator with XRE-family HTH domain
VTFHHFIGSLLDWHASNGLDRECDAAKHAGREWWELPFTASWTQKALADELSRLRKERGLSLRDVAERTGWSIAKISRGENGVSKLNPLDVRRLAELYEVADEHVARLCEMARDSIADVWWRRYERWLNPTFVEFLAYEADAARVWSVQTMFVPGLLQTSDYVKAILSIGPVRDPDRNDADYEVRLRRQRRLEDAEPIVLNALIAESVLHWQFGGAEVMRGQLAHLCTLAQRPNISVRVIPFAQPVPIYPVDLFESAVGGPAVVFSETQWGTPFTEDPIELRQARREIQRLEAVALSEQATIEMIERRIRELD